ncbi:MAG: hypothetical protein MZU97_23105 [Bacillus subtilis]|nr:hypothetical protein [Bacillus subtilis]
MIGVVACQTTKYHDNNDYIHDFDRNDSHINDNHDNRRAARCHYMVRTWRCRNRPW